MSYCIIYFILLFIDKKALFLVNTSQNGAQIYDFVANSYADKRM